ncbi:MAG: Ig-like domain-containing protein [Chitinophagaceae bacterium]|nr:Ig-like domain-containing protein [Chitinophagaceae bacterium]MCW5928315.1 Ig-like domain-containing protein [Chitinophagaceae bacterium]
MLEKITTPPVIKATIALGLICLLYACSKKQGNTPGFQDSFRVSAIQVGGKTGDNISFVSGASSIKINFTIPVDRSTTGENISLANEQGEIVATQLQFENEDKELVLTPQKRLDGLTRYTFSVRRQLKSADGQTLLEAASVNFSTAIDSTRKFPELSDEELLTKVQEQTFRYFWDFAHPVSGLARERSNGDDNLVTSGGSGFGVMAVITGIHRNFITRQQGLERLQTIVSFLKNTAQTFKGAYPHWLNGTTGTAIRFSDKDDGADLVETSLLMQGLLCARQYFDGAGAEKTLRDDINEIWRGIEWDWFSRDNEEVLYWHWSPNYGWDMNLPVKGWNECLITYVLAAASPDHGIPASVYHKGWASEGAMKNGNNYYSYVLPLGPAMGGPLFLSQYSFLGINPKGLSDSYADYELQTRNHALINNAYCVFNPGGFAYSDSCWGLTASDIPGGYTSSSPQNDVGVIAPTAAIASLPYTPEQSMKALKFFYYVLGDKLWKDYGFIDAFSLDDLWFSNSFLAIDQGPQVIMIENHRSGLLWNLFMSCPEVKSALNALGFQSEGS